MIHWCQSRYFLVPKKRSGTFWNDFIWKYPQTAKREYSRAMDLNPDPIIKELYWLTWIRILSLYLCKYTIMFTLLRIVIRLNRDQFFSAFFHQYVCIIDFFFFTNKQEKYDTHTYVIHPDRHYISHVINLLIISHR